MTLPDYDAIIVGAGFSGICAAARLEMDLGIVNVKLFDRAAQVGGTWELNRYSGAGCDVPTRLYSLSFAQRANWDKFFSGQQEILEYMQEVGDDWNIPARTSFRTEIVEATFVPGDCYWKVIARNVDTGEISHHTARVLFSCVGALSEPRPCDVPGADKFEGVLFHTARWDTSVDLEGKNVVVLGNGATASQLVPEVAKKAKQLTQIARSKHYYAPHVKNPSALGETAFGHWLQRNVPGLVSLERGIIVLALEAHFIQASQRWGKGARDRFARVCRNYVLRCAPKEYHEMLLVKGDELVPACKRRIFDSAYIPSLGRPNVELTNDVAVQINERSVTLKSGRKIDADVIILANGFLADQFATSMKIDNGRGVTLDSYWRGCGAPQAYRSTLISPFENFISLWGPSSVTGHFSAVWAIEESMALAIAVLRPIFAGPKAMDPRERSHGKSVAVKKEAEEIEQLYIQHAMKDLVYTTCRSWYRDPRTGRVIALSPAFQLTFARRARFPVMSDLRYHGVKSSPSSFLPLWQRIGALFYLGRVPDVRSDAEARRSSLHRLLRLLFRPFANILRLLGGYSLVFLSRISDLLVRYSVPLPYEEQRKKGIEPSH